MICYQDKTFCNADDCAKFESCDRALTDKVRADAARLDLPMSVVPCMDCFESMPDKSINEIIEALQRRNGQ